MSKLEVGVGRWRRKWWNFLKFRLRKSCNNPGNHGLNLFSYLAFHYVACRKRNLDWLRSAETLSFSIFWHSFRFIYKSRFGASTCAGERTYTYSCIGQRIKCAFQMPPCIMFSLHVTIAFFCFVFPWGKKIKSGETTDVWNLATCIKKPLPTVMIWRRQQYTIHFTGMCSMTISIFCQIYLFMCCNSQRFLITVNVWYFTLVNHVLYTTVHDKLEPLRGTYRGPVGHGIA